MTMAGNRGGQFPRMRRAAWTTDQWPTPYKRRELIPQRVLESDQGYLRGHYSQKGACQRLKETTKEYCNYTTLHGLRYTTTTNTKHWCERFLWIVVCALAVAVTVVLCRRTWDRFQNAPTLTTVDNTNHPIWDIPFPAVTMCNVNQVHRRATATIQKKLAEVGEVNETDAHMFLRDLPNLIRPGRIRLTREKLEAIQISLEETGTNTDDLMKMLAQPCSTAVVFCLWQDRPVECEDIISPSKSSDGNCCSFSYPINSSAQRYPTGAGEGSGLVVFVDTEVEDYFAATRPFYATKVLIHDPLEYPDSATGALVQPGESVTLAISITTIESDQSVRDLKTSQRGCLFSNERAQDGMAEGGFVQARSDNLPKGDGITLIEFASRSEQFISAMIRNIKSDRLDRENMKNLAVLKVHFEDITCLKYRREAVMTWDSLFATFGGIVGLCLGGSVLSVVEVIYYATIRFWVSGIQEERPPPFENHRGPEHNAEIKDNQDYSSWEAQKGKPAALNEHKFDSHQRRAVY